MPEIFREHWRALLIAWLVFNGVQTMPSPQDTGPTSTWGYKWAFALLHTIAAGVPRIVYTMLPQFVKFLPFNGQTQAPPDDKKPQA